jgi:hypothetical protein
MASLKCKVSPGEVVKLYKAAAVQPFVRYGGLVPGTPVASATADATGLATFTSQPSRIEFMAQRPSGQLIHLMDSTTRGGS